MADKKSIHLDHIQPLNVAPYSSTARILFSMLHGIALIIHVLSWIIATANIPNNILVSPLAQLTRQRTEIVGPCSVGSAGCLTPVYNATIGSPAQPKCTSTLIKEATSCGVDERHEDVKFLTDAFGDKKQRFDNINIFFILSMIDLISIVFQSYALIMVWVSNYRSPCAYIESLVRWFMNLIGDKVGVSFAKSKLPPGELPQPSEIQEMNPRYPRAPEYNRRWLDIALTYSLLTVSVAISVGITNFYVLLSMVTGIQCLALMGFMIDDARYQLRITDSDAYNKNYIMKQFYEVIADEKTTFDVKFTNNQADIGPAEEPVHNQIWLNRLERVRPQTTGWTQPVRNIMFSVGMMSLVWYTITYIISDAAENIILHMPGDTKIGNDAFKTVAVYYWVGTGIIGLHMTCLLLGDLLSGDRSISESPTPGNFLFDQFDGDAMFTVVILFTKIMVSWLVYTIAADVYNESGGTQTRNGEMSETYLYNLSKGLDGYLLRGILLWGGTTGFVFFASLVFFLTPSSRGYKIIHILDKDGNVLKDANGKPVGKCCTCTVGLKIKRLLCKPCLRGYEKEVAEEPPEKVDNNEELRPLNGKLYF
jgi:hypothetical protein